MKNLLILLILALLMSCESLYIQTMDTEDGRIDTVRDGQHITKIGDTLVLRRTTDLYNLILYGKYVGKIPNNYEYQSKTTPSYTVTVYFTKAVRIK